MQKISFKSYSDRETNEYRCVTFAERGRAAYCGTAYPTQESRSALACDRALTVSSESFLLRPSLDDIAIKTINGFVREGVYILQEPGKEFLCSAAFLYMFKGEGRVCIFGNAGVYHFQNGLLRDCYYNPSSAILGRSLRTESDTCPEFSLSGGTETFVLCSAEESQDLMSIFPPNLIEDIPRNGEWADRVVEMARGKNCSIAAVFFPERKGLFRKK